MDCDKRYGCCIDRSDSPLTINHLPYDDESSIVIQCMFLLIMHVAKEERAKIEKGCAAIGYFSDDFYEEYHRM